MSEYEKWRMGEIDKALKEKRRLPPLCETSYLLWVKWAEKMKDLSGRVIQNGAFNAESSQLSSQLKSFTPTSSPETDLNMGETTAAVDLSVMVVTALLLLHRQQHFIRQQHQKYDKGLAPWS